MLVVTSCDYYHLSFRTQEPFSPNPLWLGVFIFCVKIPSKPAGAWDGTKAVPVTVMGEMGQVPNILFGSYSFALTTEEKTHEVIFDTPFLSVPVIVASIARDGFTENTKFLIRNDVSENRFRFTAIDTSGYEINRNVKLYWIAIAKN